MRAYLIALAALATAALVAGRIDPGRAQEGAPAATRAAPPLAEILRSGAVDLTHTFDDRTIQWPADEPFRWEESRWGRSPEGLWYASATYGGSEHAGTHLDSPVHFAEGGATTDQIPLDRLIGPAVVVDVTARCAEDRDYRLRVADLVAWEEAHGRIPDGSIVLMRSGWGRFWPDKRPYLGSDRPGDVESLHFPGIGPEAAAWLAEERRVVGVGIDTASLDHGPSRDFGAHRILGEAGLYGLENLANLDQLPEAGATLIALPMKIGGGSGGPTRVIAILP